MTKRFRQASLSFESLAVGVEDSEDLQVQAEASTASTCDQSNVQVTVCESLCCVDGTEPYQPTNKAILACMSNNGRHFIIVLNFLYSIVSIHMYIPAKFSLCSAWEGAHPPSHTLRLAMA